MNVGNTKNDRYGYLFITIQVAFYIIFVLLLSVQSILYSWDFKSVGTPFWWIFLVAVQLANVAIEVGEIFEIREDFKHYFSSPPNYVDIIQSIVVNVYGVLQIYTAFAPKQSQIRLVGISSVLCIFCLFTAWCVGLLRAYSSIIL